MNLPEFRKIEGLVRFGEAYPELRGYLSEVLKMPFERAKLIVARFVSARQGKYLMEVRDGR